MMIPLSTATRERLDVLFAAEERELAATLLVERCGDGLPLANRASKEFWDRVRFAVLKLSAGDLKQLQREVEGANHDWRDTLMAAGFGESATAHQSWFPVAR